eukprot:192998_1
MSLLVTFVKLECEQKFDWCFPKPSYHPKNKDVVILSTSTSEENKKGIYEYNTRRNTFNKVYTYDKTFKPVIYGQFIDSKNELLYIFGDGELGIFDLTTKIMNTNTTSPLRDCR